MTAYTVSKAVIEQRRNARLQHGAQSGAVLVPLSRNVKQSVLKRMGLRQAELSWAARETLDLYARNKAKLIALDRHFEAVPLVNADGSPAGATRIYWLAHNSALRALGELRAVIAEMAREDRRFDRALQALAAEGRRVREVSNADG
jgi:hypothetical protein